MALGRWGGDGGQGNKSAARHSCRCWPLPWGDTDELWRGGGAGTFWAYALPSSYERGEDFALPPFPSPSLGLADHQNVAGGLVVHVLGPRRGGHGGGGDAKVVGAAVSGPAGVAQHRFLNRAAPPLRGLDSSAVITRTTGLVLLLPSRPVVGKVVVAGKWLLHPLGSRQRA